MSTTQKSDKIEKRASALRQNLLKRKGAKAAKKADASDNNNKTPKNNDQKDEA